MPLVTNVPEPNIWDDICKEFMAKRPPFKDDDNISDHTVKEDFDPAKTNPVFYGKMYSAVRTDCDAFTDFDASLSHPACVGYAFVDKPPTSPPATPPPAPDIKSCLPGDFLAHYIFPTLVPLLEQMLYNAQKERCFERKRTKFNALDYLTEYLYKNNPTAEKDRSSVTLNGIPFVDSWLQEHPRPPLPKSLLWSEEEASLIIQASWRGYKARCSPEIQELRQWQREWRAENENINNKVNELWAKSEERTSGTQSGQPRSVPSLDNNPFGTPNYTPVSN